MNSKFSSLKLTADDWSLINKITQAYDIWSLDCDTNHIKNYSLTDASLIDFLNDEEQMYLSLIQFYKAIPEFKQINHDDEILLIKCNLTHLIHIHHVLKDNFLENSQIGLYMSKWINPYFHQQMSKTRHSYNYFLKHPIVLKLALVCLIFTINLSRLPFEQLSFKLIDKTLIIQHQYYFLKLLWKYLNVIYNENDSRRAIQILVFQYLRYQLLMSEMENIGINQINPQQFCPLTSLVLRLT